MAGAVAERCNLLAYLAMTIAIQGFVYPLAAHWVWSDNGWLGPNGPLGGNGLLDFAGSGVVHITGGTAALFAAYIIGPRVGRFTFDQSIPFARHDIALTTLGVFCLWFSW